MIRKICPTLSKWFAHSLTRRGTFGTNVLSHLDVQLPRLARATPFGALLSLVVLLIFDSKPAVALAPDPAARGLDMFLHMSPDVAPGATAELLVDAFGYASVTDARLLSGATVEAGWDPESLGGGAGEVPKTVTATTDTDGRAHLSVHVPSGPPGELTLLVGARHGTHSRTTTVKARRTAAAYVDLHTADARVVPTSTISAWSRLTSISGKPLANTPVIISLLEGGVARHRERLVTDQGGMVMARVPIPRIDEPVWEWKLRAEPEDSATKVGQGPQAEVTLTPREETPGKPTLLGRWDVPAAGVLPGDKVAFSIRVQDATNQPLADQSILYWIGPKGTTPPASDDDWKKNGVLAKTDGAGIFKGTRDTPTLIKSTGTSLHLEVKSIVEGHTLTSSDDVPIGVTTTTATLKPEAAAIVPGLSQKLYLRVRDGRNNASASAKLKVTADGLNETITTDANGEATITWNAPKTLGATRNVGPCAGGVAAAVNIKPADPGAIPPALKNQPEGFTLCVSVDREVEGIIRVEPVVARPGDKVKLTVHRTTSDKASFSTIVHSIDKAQSVATWIDSTTLSKEVTLPADAAPGTWSVSASRPSTKLAPQNTTSAIGATFMVIPRVLPKLEVKRVGGRATPGGSLEVEASLSDGHGRGLQGSVSAIVVDAFGGGEANLGALDTRAHLCRRLLGGGRDASERCSDFLEGDAATNDAFRRSVLGTSRGHITPARDPGAQAAELLKKAFSEVVHSLEGAVFESAKSPQTLIDVRRRDPKNGKWAFNPEMFTLVTDAMKEPPTTPGGEPITLSDLTNVDPQVSFDNVARRVTRLKLFRILAAVREVRTSRSLDPNEPLFKDPNALLRRLVRSKGLAEELLLDPWGGTIEFVPSNAPPIPFLSIIRGFELHAPGPDGKLGTQDDVRDPFERVVKSGTPYAKAVDEDRIVDAKWDMVVSEETVKAWQQMFEELTGTELGAGGLGLSGVGEGGGGAGEGIGLGNIGTIGHGFGRGSFGISTGNAFWTPQVRTDANGKARLTIPLGDSETTWRIGFISVPDGEGPASATLDVASEIPVSARVDGGARWSFGDVVEMNVIVRNRTKDNVKAQVTTQAEGAAELADPAAAKPVAVDVPANGARTVHVRVTSKSHGQGTLVVTTRAPGLPEDVLRHRWEIASPGEKRVLAQSAWIAPGKERTIGLSLDHGYSLYSEPRLVLERGYDDVIAAALDSLEPERQTSTLALLDSFEASLLIERWATTKATSPRHRALAEIAKKAGERARGRFEAYIKLDEAARKATPKGPRETASSDPWSLRARGAMLTKSNDEAETTRGPACPPNEGVVDDREGALEVEPAPESDSLLPCWASFVSNAVRALEDSKDVRALARAVFALSDRSHRHPSARALVDQLRRVTKLQANGDIDLRDDDDRSLRALVYAALLRGHTFGSSPAKQDALFGRITQLRDANGSFGSSSATLAVVRALLASQLASTSTAPLRVHVKAKGFERRIDVAPDGFVNVPLPSSAVAATIEVDGRQEGVAARLERPVLRSWSRPPPAQPSPLSLEVSWPTDAKAATTGVLRISVRTEESTSGPGAEVDLRIPLPPGVTLGAATKGMSQLQGVLAIRESVHRSTVIEAPVRFGLAGKLTAPEAIARLTRSPRAPATAPARTITVTTSASR